MITIKNEAEIAKMRKAGELLHSVLEALRKEIDVGVTTLHINRLAEKLIKLVGWMLPLEELVMDIYISSDDRTYIVDLNPWGPPTDPLLLRSWDRDWSKPVGIVLMDPPAKLSGNVDVSF